MGPKATVWVMAEQSKVDVLASFPKRDSSLEENGTPWYIKKRNRVSHRVKMGFAGMVASSALPDLDPGVAFSLVNLAPNHETLHYTLLPGLQLNPD